MIELVQYQKLKAAADQAKTAADRAAGSYDEALKQLETEFDCTTPDQAKTKLAKLDKELEAAEKAFSSKLETYDRKWRDAVANAT